MRAGTAELVAGVDGQSVPSSTWQRLASHCGNIKDGVLVEQWSTELAQEALAGVLAQSTQVGVQPPKGFDAAGFKTQIRQVLPQNLALGGATTAWFVLHGGPPRGVPLACNPVARALCQGAPGCYPWSGTIVLVPLIVLGRSSANSVWNPQYGMPAVHSAVVTSPISRAVQNVALGFRSAVPVPSVDLRKEAGTTGQPDVCLQTWLPMKTAAATSFADVHKTGKSRLDVDAASFQPPGQGNRCSPSPVDDDACSEAGTVVSSSDSISGKADEPHKLLPSFTAQVGPNRQPLRLSLRADGSVVLPQGSATILLWILGCGMTALRTGTHIHHSKLVRASLQ
jgi:hypothetical protein